MRRIIFGLIGLYVLAAFATTAVEKSGMWKQCGCEPECWCKKPGLSLFHWVTPKRKHHLVTPADKRMLAEAQISD